MQRGFRPRQMQADGDGRIASVSVTANFRSKNGLCIAAMTSGRTPGPAKNIATETGAAASSASVSTNPTGRARWGYRRQAFE